MDIIGNDNYEPEIVPQEVSKRGKGWLLSNTAQLMVFLNGLILTITAFATLSVFIDEIVKERLVSTTNEIAQYVDSNYQHVQQSLSAVKTLIVMSDDQPYTQVKEYLKTENSGTSSIKEMYYIDDLAEEKVVFLSGDREYIDTFGRQPVVDFVTLVVSLKEKLLEEGGDVLTTFALPSLNRGADKDIETGISGKSQEKKEEKNFAIIKIIKDENGHNSYIMAITSLDKILDEEWLKSKSAIKNILITYAKSDLPVYSFVGEDNDSKVLYTNIFQGDFAENIYNVKVDLTINAREAFLKKIPLLMLLFGLTLTLIGTLYVRNNQAQSRKLSDMNKELAHKNFELNQEITERERLNQVIQKSARENRAIVNSVSDIILELSLDGKILFLNDAWHRVTGFENERSIGRNLFDLIYVQDQEEQKENFDQLIQGDKPSYRVFTKLRSADGSYRAVDLAMSMTRQDEDKDVRVVGTITDVEERRRAERALGEAEKKYRTIVENAAGGIYQVTPTGQFLSANPAMAKILGYDTPEDILRGNDKVHDSIYVDTNARTKFLNDINALDVAQNIELQIKRKDGSIIWVSENVRAVHDDDGTVLFYEGSMENVDQRRQAELALKEAKAGSDLANRAKSEFLANMSHELRTPLNSIIGFSEMIKNETFGKLPNTEYKDYADNIFESGNKLLRVINEILDVSRIEAGDRTLNETVVKVSETFNSCLELIEGKLKSVKMRVDNKITDRELGFVGETQAFKQMLLNLMSNAIKFSPDNSFMMLDAEIDSRGRLRVSITDTGIGMNDEELAKAISPFGQLDNEFKRIKSGTGLGLTLVKSLVELHGGELEMVSQKGIGTTATLIFPAKRVVKIGKMTKSATPRAV